MFNVGKNPVTRELPVFFLDSDEGISSKAHAYLTAMNIIEPPQLPSVYASVEITVTPELVGTQFEAN